MKNNANPLATKSLMDLREIAKALHIKNIIKYRKAELIREIERVASTEPSPVQPVATDKPKQGTGRKRGRPRRVPIQETETQAHKLPLQSLSVRLGMRSRLLLRMKSGLNAEEGANASRSPIL